jgi:DMSO/TMAO reductase YedYZ heme-binding membrane subunit
MTEQIWWHVARASGIVAWWLLAFAVGWGVLYRSRLLSSRKVPKWLLATHRFTGGTAVTFTGIHIAALVADSYVHFGLADLFVPYASEWKSGAVAWGVVAFWLLAAVQITSWFMKNLPRRLWLAIHLTSYPLFVSATMHAATAGTDAQNRLSMAAVSLALVLTTFLVSFRILGDPRKARRSTPERPSPPPANRTAGTRELVSATSGDSTTP